MATTKNPVAHFEIHGDDPEELARFYTGLFAWSIQPLPGLDYRFIRTVETDPKGAPLKPGAINGGLVRRPSPEVRGWINYVTVDSLDGALERVQRLGGKVARGRTAVVGMGWFAMLADPQGNPFAIWQDDPGAK
jgi:uncharacterized protein